MFPSSLLEVSMLSVCQRPPSYYTTKVQNLFELRKHYSNKMHPFSLNCVKIIVPKNTTFTEKMNNQNVKIFCPKIDHKSGHFRGNSVVTPWKLRTTSDKQKICTFADDKKRGNLNPHITNNFNSLFYYGKT